MVNAIAAFFSILLPGTGQLYNRQFLKGVLFLLIEHVDNIMGNVNTAIYYDLNGLHQRSEEAINYNYAMFYPGFYVYAVWDAWYHAGTGNPKRSGIPFVIAGFMGEFAVIYARYLPYPAFMIGMSMIIPMIIGMVIYTPKKAV